MKQLSIIKNERQYYAYCNEVEQLELLHNKSIEIENRIELLILLIEKWDDEHNSIPELNPVEYLELLMKTNELKSVDLQNKVGINKTTLSHILNYRRGFSKNNIRLLSDYFKVAQSAFNKKYELKNTKFKKGIIPLVKSTSTKKIKVLT